MTVGVATARDRSVMEVARTWMRDRPLVLFGLLATRGGPADRAAGHRGRRTVSSTLRFAIPLAIIAACQTPTMLTGGIDLSVAVAARCRPT